MKKLLPFLAALFYGVISSAQGVAINTNGSPADAGAALDVSSTSKGFLPPRMNKVQRDAISGGNPAAGLTVFCTDCAPAGIYSYNGTSWSTQSAIMYKVGDAAQGGIVFWVDETGQHGLVSATSDGPSIKWFNGNYTNTKALRLGTYGGEYNTNAINVKQGSGDYASSISARFAGGGFGDWYLPSKDELALMYQQKAKIGGFSANSYWSSTEKMEAAGNVSYSAWSQNLGNGTQSAETKNNTFLVRPIRRF